MQASSIEGNNPLFILGNPKYYINKLMLSNLQFISLKHIKKG